MNDILLSLTASRVRSVLNIYTAPGKPMERRERPCWAIIYKHEGETLYESGGHTRISNKANAVILPKGSSYLWQCKQGGHYFALEFDADETMENILSFPLTEGEGERLFRLLREAEQKYSLRAQGYHLEGMHALYGALLLLLGSQRKEYADGAHRARIAPALDHISQCYDQPISNDSLAALCGVSTVYFRKLFLRVMGMPPIAYLHKLRIGKAKKMLESDHESLTEIALSLGYPDIYTFSKAFKKHTGLSPTAYERSLISAPEHS